MPDPDDVRLLHYDGAAWNEMIRRRARREDERLDLRGIELPGSDLSDRLFVAVDLSGANLSQATLNRCNFADSSLRTANLNGAVLHLSNLFRVDFTGTDLTKARFDGATLGAVDFSNASLVNADLEEAVLWDLSLAGTDFAGAVTARTVWANIDLRPARNLENIRHLGPSTVGLDTVTASGGQIPEIFLRGCGVPDVIIAYVGSLGRSSNPIQLYSCFISHSSADRQFCERLYNDLQASGVRCWFAPEDLKIGDRFRDEIESAIRLHDKLLLVLTETSVHSSWVREEVESALEREDREHRQVLFPVRLDDAVMSTPQSWAASVRRQRHMGDFTGWKNHDNYRKAFDRLLRDLRASPEPA
jgi:hypothetical protein